MRAKSLAKIAAEAAIEAALQYQEMSGGRTVHEHPIETFISSKIAEKLFAETKDAGYHVALEMTFREVEELSGAERRGRPNLLLPQLSRFDVVLLRQGQPYGLIEVKKRFSASKLDKDVIRLSKAVQRYGSEFSGSVRFGLAISLQRLFENGRSDAESTIENFLGKFVWAIEPEITSVSADGDFNTNRQGRRVTGVCAYAVLFNAS